MNSMVIFQFAMLVYQRVKGKSKPETIDFLMKHWVFHGFPTPFFPGKPIHQVLGFEFEGFPSWR